MVPILLAFLAALLFGAATPAGKVLLREIDPVLLAGLLYAGAALGAAPGLRRGTTWPGRRQGRNRLRLLGAILFGGILGPIALLFGLRAASAASVSLWLNLEAVATALLGHFIFRDHLGRFGWLGVVGGIGAGVLLSAGEGWSSGVPAVLLVAAACLSWGIDNHLTALIDGLSPLAITFWKGLVAGAFNILLALAAGRAEIAPAAVVPALAVGAAAYGASVALYIESARRLGATRAQLVFASSPLFGVALAALWLGEPVGMPQFAAGALFVAAVGLLFLDRRVHDHRHVHEAMVHTHAHAHDDGHHDHEHAGERPAGIHSHQHRHAPRVHAHPHWPDLHHRHGHDEAD